MCLLAFSRNTSLFFSAEVWDLPGFSFGNSQCCPLNLDLHSERRKEFLKIVGKKGGICLLNLRTPDLCVCSGVLGVQICLETFWVLILLKVICFHVILGFHVILLTGKCTLHFYLRCLG